nr:RNA-directed DNA polymerase, eukaryota [Tanacetum cinerariifolium]
MSSAEAEYVAISASCAQVMWMRTQLQDYGFNYNKIPLYCDSQSVIAISCNPVHHSRTKHIHTRYHFIKEQVENGIIELYFVRTEYQLADMFTKALPEDRFKYLVRRIGSVVFHQCGYSGTWARIVGTISMMHDKCIILYSSIKRKVKDGSTTRFWRDAWIGDNPLERQFPRLFFVLKQTKIVLSEIGGKMVGFGVGLVILTEELPVSIHTRIYIDSISLPDFPIEIRRCRFIPRKVNILVWRALRDRIPTRWNLSRKCFEVLSLFCPMCNISPEPSSHLFWSCPLATSIWRSVFKWTDLPLPDSNNQNDTFNWLDHVRLNSASKMILHSIFGVVVWMLWRFRNNKIFEDKKMLQKDLLDQIVDVSFLWFSSRNRNSNGTDKHTTTVVSHVHVASWGRKNLQYRPEGPGPDEGGYIHNP